MHLYSVYKINNDQMFLNAFPLENSFYFISG